MKYNDNLRNINFNLGRVWLRRPLFFIILLVAILFGIGDLNIWVKSPALASEPVDCPNYYTSCQNVVGTWSCCYDENNRSNEGNEEEQPGTETTQPPGGGTGDTCGNNNECFAGAICDTNGRCKYESCSSSSTSTQSIGVQSITANSLRASSNQCDPSSFSCSGSCPGSAPGPNCTCLGVPRCQCTDYCTQGCGQNTCQNEQASCYYQWDCRDEQQTNPPPEPTNPPQPTSPHPLTCGDVCIVGDTTRRCPDQVCPDCIAAPEATTGLCGQRPTPTGPIQCGQPCTPHPNNSPNECANVPTPVTGGNCSACLPAPVVTAAPGQPTPTPRYICQPEPSVTPIPTGPIQCGQACTPHPDTGVNDCANVIPTPPADDCSACLPNPNGGGNICQPRPTTTPTPRITAPPAQPTPTPGCACDGIDYQIGTNAVNTGTIKQGDTVQFTVWGTVVSDNLKIERFKFHFQKKDASNNWVDYTDPSTNQPVVTSVPPPPIVGPTGKPGKSGSNFYYGIWTYTIPANLPAGTYRVIVPKNVENFVCAYKTTAQTGVSTGSEGGFMNSLRRFFLRFFGIEEKSTTESRAIRTQSSAEEFRIIAPTGRTLQLGTFDPNITPSPTPILERGCTDMVFSL